MKKKKFFVILIIILLLVTVNTISYCSSNSGNSSWFETLCLDFTLTILIYETIPVVLKFGSEKKYTNKEAKKTAIIITVIMYVLISIYYILLTDNPRIANPFVASFWCAISYNILKSDEEEEKTQEEIDKNKKEEEQLDKLINILELKNEDNENIKK